MTDTLYQNSDNIFQTQVTDENTNEVLAAGLFNAAEYILHKKGIVIVHKTLGHGITLVGDEFVTHIDDGDITPKAGEGYQHQFVVWDNAGNKRPPIFNKPVTIIKVINTPEE